MTGPGLPQPPDDMQAPPPRRPVPWRRIIPVVLIVALVAAAWLGGLQHQLSLPMLQMRGDSFRAGVQLHPVLASIIFLCADIAAVLILLPVASLMTLFSGFLFGTFWGGTLVILGASIGSTLVFLIARSSFGEPLRARAHGLYARVAVKMEENAVSYLLFVRFVPVFPLFIVNTLPALFDVSLRTFFWTTVIGILPVTYIYANLGQALGSIHHIHDLMSGGLLLAFLLLGVLALVPVALKRLKP